ncbi:MAG: YbaB/EbfC family nucleoid-associated protein [Thermodesulfobacteriota bacterium]
MNIQQIMQQAQQFQQRLAAAQEELAGRTVTSTVGGGMVSATVNGRYELVELRIDREVIRPDDADMLRDLVMAAVNDGLRKAQEMARAEMAKLTGGVSIPGLF